MVDLVSKDARGKPLGPGPLLDQAVIDKFLAADQSANKKYFDWMLYQAGGGQEGETNSLAALEESKEFWIDQRTNGYTDENGDEHPPVNQEDAEAAWEASLPALKKEIMICDQDIKDKR